MLQQLLVHTGKGNKMGILGENTWAKLTLSLLLFALLLHLVSFSTPHWAKPNEHKTGKRSEHIGLWKYCTYPINGGERCDDFVNTITSGLYIMQLFLSDYLAE